MARWKLSYRSWMLPLMVVLSLGLRIEHRYFFRNFYLDTEVQLASAQSWLEGRGFGYRYVEGPDLSETNYRSAHVFMPGYTAAVLPFYLALGNWFDAAFVVDVISLLLLYLALILTWHELRGDRWYLLLLFLFLGISPAPLHYLMSSGLLAVSLHALSLAVLLRAIREHRVFLIGISMLLAVAAAATRSAYVPLVLAGPLIVFFYGRLTKQSVLRKWGGISTIMACLVVLGIQALKSGDESFFDTMSQKWYFDHLLYVDPFPFKTFFYYGVPHELWIKDQGVWALVGVKLAAYGLSLLMIGLLIVLSRKLLFSTHPQSGSVGPWVAGSWIIGSLNVGMLILLSLKVPPESWNWKGFWTFVMEPRYYLPIMWNILVIFFWIGGNWTEKPLRNGVRIFLFVALMGACSYPVYVKFRIHILGNTTATFVEDPRSEWMEKIRNRRIPSDTSLIITSSANTHIGEMANAITLPWEYMSRDTLFASKAVILWGLSKSEDIPKGGKVLDRIHDYIWWEISF